MGNSNATPDSTPNTHNTDSIYTKNNINTKTRPKKHNNNINYGTTTNPRKNELCLPIETFWEYISNTTNIDITNIKNSDKIYIQHVVAYIMKTSYHTPWITEITMIRLFSNKLFQYKVLNYYMLYNKQCINAIVKHFSDTSTNYLTHVDKNQTLWCVTESPIMPILSTTSTYNKLHTYASVILGRTYTSMEYLCAYDTSDTYVHKSSLNGNELDKYIKDHSKVDTTPAYMINELKKPFYMQLEIQFREDCKCSVYKYNNIYIICPPYNVSVNECTSPKDEDYKNTCTIYMYSVSISNAQSSR
jgi:hypothetical protein